MRQRGLARPISRIGSHGMAVGSAMESQAYGKMYKNGVNNIQFEQALHDAASG